jgi:protein-S-isoprenylcysteine O-methyltransferase Ste14
MSHLISGVAFPVFLLSLLTLGLRGNLFSAAPAVIACQAIVKAGPCRFVGHPIYAGAMLILWASVAGHLSLAGAGIGAVALLFVLGKIVHEERLLRASVPGYTEYARSTKVLVPFVM